MKFEIVLTSDEAEAFISSPIAIHTDGFKIAAQLRKQLPCDAKIGDAVWVAKGEMRQTPSAQILVESTPSAWLTRNEAEPTWGRWWDKAEYSIERA